MQKKYLSTHTQAVAVNDVESEVDILLARASIFAVPSNISDWTICPETVLNGAAFQQNYLSTLKDARLTVELTRLFHKQSFSEQAYLFLLALVSLLDLMSDI